jgi:predicted negative regulator of RcsB-dependent stress response
VTERIVTMPVERASWCVVSVFSSPVRYHPQRVPTHHLFRSRVRRLVAETIAEHRTTTAALDELRTLLADDSISAYGLRMLGALELECGDPTTAASHWSAALALRKDGKDIDAVVEALLGANALLCAGKAKQALAKLDTLAKDRNLVAEREQARGDALVALGRLDEARKAYVKGQKHVGNDVEDRLAFTLDLAGVELERGRPEQARRVLDEALAGDQYAGELGCEARLVRARLSAMAGDNRSAIADLCMVMAQTRDAAAMRERIVADRAFAPLVSLKSVAELLRERRAGARWLDAHPQLAALREHAGLRARGVTFVDEAAAREGGDSLRAYYGESLHLGTLWVPPMWAECQRIAAPLWLLASGPAIPGARHVGELKAHVVLYVDPSAPERVWLGPHAEFPAALLTELPADGDAIAAALDSLYLHPPQRITELPRTLRAFMGYPNQLVVPSPYSGEMEGAGPHELDRHYNFSPALDPLIWGGAYADDPWPDAMPPTPQVRMIMLARERRQQRRGTVARLTRRALFSRAHVGYEIHQVSTNTIYVWHIRYKPNPYPATIERYNAACGTDYPSDLPADVVAGIVGFDWLTAASAEAQLGVVEPQLVPAYLAVIAAIRCEDLEVTQLLREWAAKLDLIGRRVVANLCLSYGWRTLLEQLTLAEPDEELRGLMLQALIAPMPETEFSDMGEPVNVYTGGEDDEYEDDDDDDDDDA